MFEQPEPGDGAAGGGSTSSTSSTGSTASIEPTCVDFCSAKAANGCASPDCENICDALFNGVCDATIRPFLECVPELLNQDCVPNFPEDPQFPCTVASDDFSCNPECGSVSSEIDGFGCVGEAECSFGLVRTACDDAGTCLCSVDGLTVGSCSAVLGGVDGCIPALNCCKLFIPDL